MKLKTTESTKSFLFVWSPLEDQEVKQKRYAKQYVEEVTGPKVELTGHMHLVRETWSNSFSPHYEPLPLSHSDNSSQLFTESTQSNSQKTRKFTSTKAHNIREANALSTEPGPHIQGKKGKERHL